MMTPSTMMLVDVGSNALRATIFNADRQELWQGRYGIRLGDDVFTKGFISKEKIEQLLETFRLLWLKCRDYSVTHFLAIGTSAIREAQNNKEVIESIERETGLILELISGQEEAKLVYSAAGNLYDKKNTRALHLDIGGGSAELIAIEKGLWIQGVSLPLGAVRLLQEKTLLSLEKHIDHGLDTLLLNWSTDKKYDFLVGTGGNFKSLLKLAQGSTKKSILQKSDIETILTLLASFDYDDRMHYLDLKADRADVILPATLLTYKMMEKFSVDQLLVPDVGLREGMLNSLL
jgi:exopolyphosphatase/guanosine-5'-triphosphate,3'-diphosphate pyrophosphatase